MRPTHGSELDVAQLVTAFERRVAGLRPDQRDLALRTLRRLTPAAWTLEWYVPWWLGGSFGLGRDQAEELVLGNLLGLVSIRLQDDLLDGDVAGPDIDAASRLGPTLLDEALAVYRRRLDPGSPFWPFLERTMAEWRRTSAAAGPLSWSDLTRRAAPLRIAGLGVCLMAGRLDRWGLVERCLDHALAALVRYDQVCDWEDDLSAGRWNGFVASVSTLPQDAANRGRNRTLVQVSLMAHGAAEAEFAMIRGDALRAAGLASRSGCPPLAAFLASYAERTAAQGAEVAAHYRASVDSAAALMFGYSPAVAETG